MYKITSSIAFHESNASAIPPIADHIFNGKMMRIGRDPQFDKLSFGQKIEYNSSIMNRGPDFSKHAYSYSAKMGYVS